MQYDYLNMSLDELLKQYYKNNNSIEYYKSKIKQSKKINTIIIGINFFFTWSFVFIGLYSVCGNNLLANLLGFSFIFVHFFCYTNIDTNVEKKIIINNLENQNEFIRSVLEIKYNYKNVNIF